MMLTRRAVLGAGLALAGVRSDVIRIAVAAGARNGESAYGDGVAFGLHEAARAAQLLGRPLEVADDAPVAITAGGALEADGRRFELGAGAEAIAETLVRARQAGLISPRLVVTEWHHTLSRYGASELNERFAASGQPMTAAHWLGWMAAKIAVESALRARAGEGRAAAIARLRYDGHKGRPLGFGPDTRRLVQPLFLIDPDKDIVIWPER